MSNQWREYMTLLATPGLPSCSNTNYLAGTSNPDFGAGTSNPEFGAGTYNSEPEYYIPNMVTVTQGLDNIDIHYTEPTQSHTPLSENFIPHENDAEDPIGDSFVNESDEASEPDEAEYPIPPEDGPNHVDINIMAETFAQGHVKCNPSFGIKHVIQNVKDQTGYDVPYQKAWYSLKKTREIVYGTWESSVRKLPKYLGAIQKYNPGTIVEWKHKAFQQSTGSYVLGYVFWAFKPCIDGFQFCRKIISVDGTHLYTKYKHKLLIAAAMDGNQQVLPLAFAIVDEETYPSCKWFLQQLSRHVIRGRRGMCLISDRHGGLIKAVREGPNFVSPHGVHRYCLQYVCSNFNSNFKNMVLKDLCWQAGSEYQLRKFNRIMEEIKKQQVKAFAYLDQINKEKWTASHDGG
ncbi:UNVERIFIED_CONTAM: hypothetical protein Sradi_4862800 [Sesamum radiatum]|uniref:MULE transposase domain-containing protein n=1 Tax=Sesamum radiatum TaxID=300843 RepID=A0AAW2MYB7_SESRA